MDFAGQLSFIIGSVLFIQPCLTFLISPNLPPCEQVSEYIALRSAISSQPCISDTQIWSLIEPVVKKQRTCLDKVLKEITAYIEAGSNNNTCECVSSFPKNHLSHIGSIHDDFKACYYHNPDCQYLYEYFYLRHGQHNALSPCQTHHHVWKHLRDMHNSFFRDLQADLLLHLSLTFSSGHENLCSCKERASLATQPSTTMKVTLTSKNIEEKSTALMQTNTPENILSQAIPKCLKYGAIFDIANSHPETHPGAKQCTNGNRASHEAYVMVNCNVGTPDSWKKGENVMSLCDKMPLYTPVAAVSSDSTWTLSGIFVGCAKDGFKFAYQDCGTSPTVVHIEGRNGTGTRDPNNYYVITM